MSLKNFMIQIVIPSISNHKFPYELSEEVKGLNAIELTIQDTLLEILHQYQSNDIKLAKTLMNSNFINRIIDVTNDNVKNFLQSKLSELNNVRKWIAMKVIMKIKSNEIIWYKINLQYIKFVFFKLKGVLINFHKLRIYICYPLNPGIDLDSHENNKNIIIIKKLNLELNSLKEDRDNLKVKVNNLNVELQIIIKNRDELRDELTRVTKNESTLKGELQGIIKNRDELRDELQSVAKSESTLKKEVQGIIKNRDELRVELTKITKNEKRDYIKNILKSRDELLEELQNVTKNENTLQDELRNIIKNRDELREELTNVTKNNDDLQEKLSTNATGAQAAPAWFTQTFAQGGIANGAID
ncbi:C-type lectin domain family 4 member M-like isoform X2 [Rhizophagus clarus]|uniref:C-type lectin domain family 4 member M-like isoform X2 n=1 Tax=Rhizophagus clarus TaxID=94130 RepID=A0A8H3R068_9GLOM|nr:C-type lectin domain family 4 member M-like isoform X2 [Rhizophagus clarus]